MSDRDKPVKPCICGRSQAAGLYGNGSLAQKMAPDRADVKTGTIIIVALAAIAGIFSRDVFVAIFLLIIPTAVIIILTLIRLAMRHKLKCSIRWAAVSLFGLGAWVSIPA